MGLIPARAGNTVQWQLHCTGLGAHPRSRGEHDLYEPARTSAAGSSPLARGTHMTTSPVATSTGLIPARAGNTGTRRAVWPSSRAHPRSRGEHAGFGNHSPLDMGSSPLARGTPERSLTQQRLLGLIPARAGNTTTNGEA